jgi:ureidoacrylate peracid hydrolase
MTTVRIDARPAPLDVDPSRTAVVVLDMQNDFGSPHGMMALAGGDR